MEARFYETVREDRRPAGRSTADLRCPFCGTVTQVRLWALAGSGKRCDCGAKFTGRPGTHLAVSVAGEDAVQERMLP